MPAAAAGGAARPGWTSRLPLLTGGPRDLPARQQTMRDADRLELRPARRRRAARSSAGWPSSPAAARWRRPRPVGESRSRGVEESRRRRSVSSSTARLLDSSTTLDPRRVAGRQEPARPSRRGRRRAALRDAGDDPRVRAGASWRRAARRRRRAPPTPRGTWRWPSGREPELAGPAARRPGSTGWRPSTPICGRRWPGRWATPTRRPGCAWRGARPFWYVRGHFAEGRLARAGPSAGRRTVIPLPARCGPRHCRAPA